MFAMRLFNTGLVSALLFNSSLVMARLFKAGLNKAGLNKAGLNKARLFFTPMINRRSDATRPSAQQEYCAQACASSPASRRTPSRLGATLFALLLACAFVAPASAEPDLPELPQSVNINTADAPTIAGVLNGVGLSRAAAIIAYRERHGEFATIDDLTNVKGVGERTLERNAGRIRLAD